MILFLSATDYEMTIVGQSGEFLRRIRLAEGWLRSGHTRAGFAIAFLEALTNTNLGKEASSWRSLRKAFRRDPLVRELFETVEQMNCKFFSNDPTAVESLLRHTFRDFRPLLPLIVYSIPQHYECWLGEPWTRPIEVSSNGDLVRDGQNAAKTHQFVVEQIEVRRLQKEAIANQKQMERDLQLQARIEQSYRSTSLT